MKTFIVDSQNIEFYIGNLKSNNLQIKLDALSAIQWYVADRFKEEKGLTGEEVKIANSLLDCLIGEMRNKVIDEILSALRVLTESIFIPQANWKILVSEFLRFKDDWLIEQSLSLITQTCDVKYIELIEPFCKHNNPSIATTANESIAEIEYVTNNERQNLTSQ
jgi:hypothetical protein